MTSNRIIKPFWERRWLILTTTLTVAIGTFCWLQTLPYAYESSIVLAATSKDGQILPSGQVPRLYRELKSAPVFHRVMLSEPFNERQASGAANEILVERLSNSIGLLEEHRGSSVIVELRYLDTSPEAAEKGANVLGREIASAELQREAEAGFAFKVVQSASPASGPIKPRRFALTFLALGGGLLLGLVFAASSELLKYGRRVRFPSTSASAG